MAFASMAKINYSCSGYSTATPSLPSLEKFLQTLISSSRIQVPTLLCTLIYLERISPKLPPVSNGSQSNSRKRALIVRGNETDPLVRFALYTPSSTLGDDHLCSQIPE